MSKTALIICDFILFKVFAVIADSCTSQEESVSCTEVRRNIMDYCLGYTQPSLNPLLSRSTKICKNRHVGQSKTGQQR